ncbi:MAG: cation diffusion facilitator family transporter [Lachnospiraceae bacterium]|nr:cation diffusion facilitator family transporter [Lachnospiraceae bacterium]
MDFLARIFIKHHNNVKNPEVRKKYGLLSGYMGIVFNMILFVIKLIAGFASGSVAIMADAFNNLSDTGGSLVALLGFKMSGKKADPEHPFGHGRIEYVTGLIIAIAIILMGVELMKSSVEKILSPTEVYFSRLTVVVLLFSIFIKLFMFSYNRDFANKIGSAALKSLSADSLSDSIASSVVLISLIVSEYSSFKLDGIMGLLVSFFIVITGLKSARDTIDPLLGNPPSRELVESIEKYVASYDEIIGMHDLVVHDYGPGRMMISFHAEVRADGDFVKLHDIVDTIERKLKKALSCDAVIHMDPIFVNDEKTVKMKNLTTLIVNNISPRITIHDFRMVPGVSHTKLIFDVVVPYDFEMSDDEVVREIKKALSMLSGNIFAVVEVDKPLITKEDITDMESKSKEERKKTNKRETEKK